MRDISVPNTWALLVLPTLNQIDTIIGFIPEGHSVRRIATMLTRKRCRTTAGEKSAYQGRKRPTVVARLPEVGTCLTSRSFG